MSAFTDSTVESAALAWLGELGYAVLHGPAIAPGERASEPSAATANASCPGAPSAARPARRRRLAHARLRQVADPSSTVRFC